MPGLATILVGEDPASQVYIRNKNKQTVEAGMLSFGRRPTWKHIRSRPVSYDKETQCRPIGKRHTGTTATSNQISQNSVIDAIDPAKDVDGFHLRNVGLHLPVEAAWCLALRSDAASC